MGGVRTHHNCTLYAVRQIFYTVAGKALVTHICRMCQVPRQSNLQWNLDRSCLVFSISSIASSTCSACKSSLNVLLMSAFLQTSRTTVGQPTASVCCLSPVKVHAQKWPATADNSATVIADEAKQRNMPQPATSRHRQTCKSAVHQEAIRVCDQAEGAEYTTSQTHLLETIFF